MSRPGGRPRRAAASVRQLPYQSLVNRYAPIEILSSDQVEAIIAAALSILENQGMRFLEASSRRLLQSAGAQVDEATMQVRFDRALVLEKLALAPPQFRLRARNAAHDLVIGGNNLVFCAVGGPAFCSDLDRGRRAGTHAEVCDFLRLVQSLNIIHQESGGPFEAMDLPPETRHLDLYLAQLTLLDKNCQANGLGRLRTADCIEMNRIALGVRPEALSQDALVMAIVNTNSPMQLDIPMTEAVLELASNGQACCITPFTLAGSMSPVTLAGTLAQQTAEVLAVATLAQTVRAGARIIYGSFASNVDMRSGAPALGTPEYSKAALASGQIARRLKLPLRSSNTTSSNCVDAQAAYESSMSLWGAIMGHANLVYHAAGWLESGLTSSFEKFILDVEQLQMMAEVLQPLESDGNGSSHAYKPLLAGESTGDDADATLRANRVYRRALADYQTPARDPATLEALDDYVRRRTEAGGSPPQT